MRSRPDLRLLAALGVAVLWLVAGAAGSNTLLLPRAQHAFGYRNPEVRQSNVASTVCKAGYSATIRPPVSYTTFLKREELRYYKLPGTVSDYELDHLISLSLGGSPYDTRNLWMQPDSQARRDDRLEARWHRDLCAGRITLRTSQRAELAYKRAHG
jgi:hypothetical protein